MSANLICGTVYAEWTEGFWRNRWDICRDRMVPHMWKILKDDKVSHCWKNFLIADSEVKGEYSDPPFHDGDFYRWLEAAAYVYGNSSDKSWSGSIRSNIEFLLKT